jgi:hypothetical protein
MSHDFRVQHNILILLYYLFWLPIGHDLRTTVPVISIGYKPEIPKKTTRRKSNALNRPQKHIIHKAIRWKKMLDDGEVGSLSELAKKEGLTRARVTQIMNLLKLPDDMREFLLGLENPKEIKKYSERRLRGLTVSEKEK